VAYGIGNPTNGGDLMAKGHDAAFDFHPEADLPFERDLSVWLNGASIQSYEWTISDPGVLEMHDDSVIGGNVCRVWLRGTGAQGRAKVVCKWVASDNRTDARTWLINVRER
jgi:hypothetical protein